MAQIWTADRRKRVAIVLLLALLISMPLGYFLDSTGEGLLRAGDFPGFYVLPELLKRGHQADFYVPQVQASIEAEFWPEFKGSFYHSVYPPYDAIFLYPLVWLGPEVGQWFWLLASLACLYWGSILVSNRLGLGPEERLFRVSLLLLLGPVFYGVFGAQNSAFSTLLALLIYLLCHVESTKVRLSSALQMALCSVLWCFKPQFGLFAGLAVATHFLQELRGSRRATAVQGLVGLACGALCLFVLGTLVVGVDWPQQWVDALVWFSSQNYSANAHNQVSLTALLQQLSAVKVSPIIASVPLLLASVYVGFDLRRYGYLLGPTIILLSPQTLFYDLTLSLFFLLFVMDLSSDRKVWLALCGLVVVGLCTYYREVLGALPLTLLNLLAWSALCLRRKTWPCAVA